MGKMSASQYNPAIHHRRSIRLKGHDYAGGGLYFVTICAHRDAGAIFADPSVQEMVGRVWRELPQSPAVGAGLVPALSLEEEGTHKGCRARGTHEGSRERGTHEGSRERGTHEGSPYAIMPDHFHALVQMRGGDVALGDVIGAFKSLVVHEYIAGVKAGRFPRFPGKIWHRNYYEMIVRTPEAAEKIAEYIRMNPWKLVQHGKHNGQSFRMIGNPALLQREKIAMLCSRNCPPDVLATAEKRARKAGADCCFLSGFHSPPENAILSELLQSEARLICCPAWGIDEMRIPRDWLPALEQNRMLILEMCDRTGNLAAAEARNRFVIENAADLWTPHVNNGGMLDGLIKEARPTRAIGGNAQRMRAAT